MVALDTIKPHLTPDFVTAFRVLGKQVGYRNLGRAIAYAKLPTATADKELSVTAATPAATVSRNGRKGNGRKFVHAPWCRGRRHKGSCAPGCAQCCEDQSHRFTHDLRFPFTYSVLRPSTWKDHAGDSRSVAQRCDLVARNLPGRKCCKYPMGVTPDYTDAHHWRYQCAVDPKHQEDTEISIAVSP